MDVRMAWIIGGPASGKTTQSQNIARKYGFAYIDPCALIARQVEFPEANGKTSKKVLTRRCQIPLQQIIPLIETKINSARSKGVVIDGYPGSLEDAVVLEAGLGRPDIVIALEVDEETSSRRSAEAEQIYRPSLTEYQVASRAVIQRYGDITVMVDCNQEAHRVFEVIQFNIDSLNLARTSESRARRFNSLGSK